MNPADILKTQSGYIVRGKFAVRERDVRDPDALFDPENRELTAVGYQSAKADVLDRLHLIVGIREDLYRRGADPREDYVVEQKVPHLGEIVALIGEGLLGLLGKFYRNAVPAVGDDQI